MVSSFQLVFSNYRFIILATTIFAGLLFPLLIISEYLFLEPYVIGHIPNGTEFGFGLIVAVSVLSGLVLSMNVYRIRILRSSKKKMGGSVLGSVIGAAAGACSCGPFGFAVISTFGSVGGIATSFLTSYEIPIRIGAIGILLFTWYTTSRSLKFECKISSKNSS